MDFEFFESLSKSDATKFLNNFLEESGKGFKQTATEIQKDGILVDYTIDSVTPVMEWILKRLKTLPLEVDESLPDWIKQSEDYIKGLFEFDEDSGILVLRAAYYLGESFNRKSENISWATGKLKYAEQNMPIITGFKHNMELAPILITENMFNRVLKDITRLPDIRIAIDYWEKNTIR